MINFKVIKVIYQCQVKIQSLFNEFIESVVVNGFKWIALEFLILERVY